MRASMAKSATSSHDLPLHVFMVPGTLVALLRRSLAPRWGVRAARTYAALVSIGATATIWIVSHRYGPDETALSLVARSAAVLTWVSGGIAALALAAPPKDVALVRGIEALASTRGFSDEAVALAEMTATVRLLIEVIVFPLVAIGLFVLAFVAGGRLDGAAWPIIGSVAFGLVASIVLGVTTSACRRWGGAQGRRWLVVVVLLPWLIAEMVLPERAAALVSIPGLLGRVWQALTGQGS
jgi:hypothetical protein